MSGMTTLAASDGHRFGAYRTDPKGERKGAVVIVQEIFGLTDHIKDVCARFAKAGYVAMAPALFDRVAPNTVIDYKDVAKGREVRGKISIDEMVADLTATVKEAANSGPVGMVGYCFGGTLAWVSSSRIPGLGAAVGYYGGSINQYIDDRPKCPVLLHFAEHDHLVPLSDVETFRARYPEMPIHVYEGAEHGFNCNARPMYNPEAAKLAEERTLAFLAECL